MGEVSHLGQKFFEVGQGIRFSDILILAPTQHAREAHCHSRLMAAAALDAFEPELEDKRWLNSANRTKLLDCRTPDNGVHFAKFFVAQARISFGERHQFCAVPNSER